jgi:hypothetical protein
MQAKNNNKHFEGIYVGRRVKTVYNVITNKVEDFITEIEIIIELVSPCQYIVFQKDLSNGRVIKLLCLLNPDNNLFSTSVGGFDLISFNSNQCTDSIEHIWTIPIDDSDNLVNACTTLYRI